MFDARMTVHGFALRAHLNLLLLSQAGELIYFDPLRLDGYNIVAYFNIDVRAKG